MFKIYFVVFEKYIFFYKDTEKHKLDAYYIKE
jgi:hypothetical protein